MKVCYSVVEKVSKALRNNALCRRIIYDPLKIFLRHRMATFSYLGYYFEHNHEVMRALPEKFAGDGKTVVGIIKDPFHYHEPYAEACQELGVGYRMVDVFAADWVDRIRQSGCDLFLAWPVESIAEWKKLYDDRLRFLVEQMGKKLYPDLTACWIYGSKERQVAWLEVNGFAHPKTWVFYNEAEAKRFLEECDFESVALVGKNDIGATSAGVKILRSRSAAGNYLKKAFGRGLQGYFADKQTWQWRHVLLQEYLPDVKEWRVHRIGDSFFGFGKLKHGEFHSGSGETDWVSPPKEAFDLAWAITEKGRFRSMAVDIFETKDGRFLVNELQCIYGQHSSVQLVKDDVSGRFLHETSGAWKFDAGEFAGNHGCTLRVQDAVKMALHEAQG